MKINRVLYFTISRRRFVCAVAVLLLIFLASCNTVKKVPQGEYLLNRNKIVYRFGTAQKSREITDNITDIEKFEIPQRIAPSEVLPYVRQKPNTRIFFVFPFYLYLYGLPDSVNTAKAKADRDSAYVIKARRKGWTPEKLKKKIDRKTGREWIMSQGEPPVILDSSLTRKSAEQVKAFLFNKGYFNADVKDSVHIKGQKADVSYIIKPGKPYRIRNISYAFEDPTLAAEIFTDTANSKIRRNDIYDKDVLDAEMDRITTQLNNVGYYYFLRQYIYYTVYDTSDPGGKTHNVDIVVNIKKFLQRDKYNKDSIIETNHVRYHIRHVTVQMDYDPTQTFYSASDSVNYEGLTIIYQKGHQSIKPGILKPKIFISPGDIYSVNDREGTYTGLSQLNAFSYISIKYVPVNDTNYVDCYIQLMPVVKHSVGTELDGTNTSGDLGVQGDLSYANYNQFKGG